MKNLFKYSRDYSRAVPQLIEGPVFKTIIPLSIQATQQVTPQGTRQVDGDKTESILVFCHEPKTRSEIQKHLGLKDREHFRTELLHPLIKQGLLALTIPDKPNSPRQKYYSANTTPQGTRQVTPQVDGDKTESILAFCIEPKTRDEIQKHLGLKDREHFRSEVLNPLIRQGLLVLTIPDKPNSPRQKYYFVKNKRGVK